MLSENYQEICFLLLNQTHDQAEMGHYPIIASHYQSTLFLIGYLRLKFIPEENRSYSSQSTIDPFIG
ncbi:hypothetical protein D3C86_1307480 [compost metagenome]